MQIYIYKRILMAKRRIQYSMAFIIHMDMFCYRLLNLKMLELMKLFSIFHRQSINKEQ